MSRIHKKSSRAREYGRFIAGIPLNEGYFKDLVQPIIRANFSELKYDAGLVGPCSDALGFDTRVSMDHWWGLRLQLFLAEEDHSRYVKTLRATLRENLPVEYKGFPTNWNFNRPDNGARPEFAANGKVNPNIEVLTVRQFVEKHLGIGYGKAVSEKEWFSFPEQELLHLTSGKLFHCGLNQMDGMRATFAYYPHDVWLFKMRCIWGSIAEEQAFIGRCHEVGDPLGESLIATRIVNKLMKLCFYLERQYYPYSKWFGTAFSRLQCAVELAPILRQVLSGKAYEKREQALCDSYVKIAEKHNALNITEPAPLEIVDYYGRGYRGLQTLNLVQALTNALPTDFASKLGIQDLDCTEARFLE